MTNNINDKSIEESNSFEVQAPDSSLVVNEPDEVEINQPDEISDTEAVLISMADWNTLHQNITEIHDSMTNRLKYDAAKERAFERLYKELDELKKNKSFEDYKSLFIDLLLLFDRIQLFKGNNGGSDVLASILDELTEILSKQYIEIIKNDQDFFDPRFQRIVKTQEVDTPDLDGRVIRILREGFTSRFGILRPQEVIVGKYPPPSKEPEPSAEKEA